MIAFCAEWIPKWNPMNVCSYHLQEAGATPTQELAYSLATAIDVLDAVRDSGQVSEDRFPAVVASISFFVNAGIRFVEEICKMRAFTDLWDRITLERYGVTDPKLRRFRYGVQVNSLGLTEAQPENNVQRIVLEMLAVTMSKDARARSVQLPAWNEALGLPRPWDQQWSLRMQQVLAYETDLLEYDDLFAGSHVIEARTAELIESAQAELDDVTSRGGAFAAIDELKGRLVSSMAERTRRIENGDLTVVGVNRFQETAPSPLDGDDNVMKVDPAVEAEMIADVNEWRSERDNGAVKRSLDELRRVAESGANIMPATVDLAHAGGTTGEWAGVLREVFGEYRAPTGVAAAVGVGGLSAGLRDVAERVKAMPGGPPRLLVAKPGLDGHSNGAEQIAVAARDAGHGGDLPGHPVDARADRRRGPRRGRRRRRPVDPVGQPPRAGARGRGSPSRGRGRRTDRARGDHPGGRSTQTPRSRRSGRVHAEGLRARPDHERNRRPRRRTPPPRPELT